MSHDISLEIDTGAGNMATVAEWNITYNLSPMIRRYPPLKEDGIKTISGMNAAAAADIIAGLRDAMERDSAGYSALNPPNGWGDYDGLLEFCNDFVAKARANPACVVDIW